MDRNCSATLLLMGNLVALRKESVDRNENMVLWYIDWAVALRKESVDRNASCRFRPSNNILSLSARRAWIEILSAVVTELLILSLSARRAWIEINTFQKKGQPNNVALRKESVDRNAFTLLLRLSILSRSPQGERG